MITSVKLDPFWPVAPQTVTATGNGKSNGKISENVRSFTKWSSAKTQVTRLPITSHHVKTDSKPWVPKYSWVKPKSPHASPTHPFHPHATQVFRNILFSRTFCKFSGTYCSWGSTMQQSNVCSHNIQELEFLSSPPRLQTDICTLKQQLIDHHLWQRQWNFRGTKNLWNAWVDT